MSRWRSTLLVSAGWAAAFAWTAHFGWAAMTVEDRAELADGLYARGLYEMALEEYAAVAREEPDFPRRDVVLFRAGECLRKLGREEEAQDYYEKVATQYPDSEYRFRADLRRAEHGMRAGRPDAVSRWLSAAMERRPPREWAAPLQYHLAAALEAAGQTSEAVRVYRQVTDEFGEAPVAPLAALRLAELYRRAGSETDAQRRLYELAAERAPDAHLVAEALFRLGEVAYRQGDYAAALSALERLRAEHPEDPRAKESMSLRAWTLYRLARVAEALELAEDVLSREPDDVSALYLKAHSLRSLKRMQDAAAVYERLREIVPADAPLRAPVLYESAAVALEMGRGREAAEWAAMVPSEAGELFEQALRLQAEAWFAAGDPARAREAWRAVCERGSGGGAEAARAWFELGRLSQQLGDTNEAMRAYARVTASFPDHAAAAPALHALAALREAAGDDEASSKDWKTLVERFPMYEKADEAVFRKAANEARRNRRAEAQETLRGFSKRFPESKWRAQAAYLSGAMAEQAERWSEAEAAYRESVAAAQSDDDRIRAQWRLAFVIQKQGREEDAAAAYDALLETAAATNLPPELLEWLTRQSLEAGAAERAARAARVWTRIAAAPEQRLAAWCCLGRAERMLGHGGAAEAAYAEGLKEPLETSEAAEGWLALGDLRFAAGRCDAAKQAFERAGACEAAAARVRAQSYFGLGRVAEAAGDADAATKYYLGVALLYDDENLSAESLWRAAELMRRSGKSADAEKVMRELAERYPANRWIGSRGEHGKDD